MNSNLNPNQIGLLRENYDDKWRWDSFSIDEKKMEMKIKGIKELFRKFEQEDKQKFIHDFYEIISEKNPKVNLPFKKDDYMNENRRKNEILEFLDNQVNFFYIVYKFISKADPELKLLIDGSKVLKLIETFKNILTILQDNTSLQTEKEQLEYFISIAEEYKIGFGMEHLTKKSEYQFEVRYGFKDSQTQLKHEGLSQAFIVEQVRSSYNNAILLLSSNIELSVIKKATGILFEAIRKLPIPSSSSPGQEDPFENELGADRNINKVSNLLFDSFLEDLFEILLITIEEKIKIYVLFRIIELRIKRNVQQLEYCIINDNLDCKNANSDSYADFALQNTGPISNNSRTGERASQSVTIENPNQNYKENRSSATKTIIKDLIISVALKFIVSKCLQQKNSEESLQKIKGYEFEIQTSDNFYRAKVYNLALQGYMNTYKKMKLHEFRDGIEEKILYYKSFCLLLGRIVQAREKLKDYFKALKFGLELLFNMVNYYPEILKPIENIVDQVVINIVKQIYLENSKDENNQYRNLTDRVLKYFKYKLADKLRQSRLEICQKKNQKTKDSFKIYEKDDYGDADVDSIKLTDQMNVNEWKRFNNVLNVSIEIYKPACAVQLDCVNIGFRKLYTILTNPL